MNSSNRNCALNCLKALANFAKDGDFYTILHRFHYHIFNKLIIVGFKYVTERVFSEMSKQNTFPSAINTLKTTEDTASALRFFVNLMLKGIFSSRCCSFILIETPPPPLVQVL
jgi:hypothetical protein